MKPFDRSPQLLCHGTYTSIDSTIKLFYNTENLLLINYARPEYIKSGKRSSEMKEQQGMKEGR